MPRTEANDDRYAPPVGGPRETVLLLHGTASSGGQWRNLAEAMPSGWNVLAPDLYGYGEAVAWQGEGAFSLAAEAALAESVLGAGAERIHLVGHSYGGVVALRLAAQWPERLASLVLIEPVAFHLLRDAPAGSPDQRLLGEVRQIAELVWRSVANGDYRGGMAGFVDYWNGDGAWLQAKPELQAALIRRLPKVALDYWAALGESMPLAAYGQIAAPSLILSGSRSPQPARRVAAIVGESLPNCRRLTIEGAGHMLPLTHKDAVNTAVLEHLLRHSQARCHPAAA